MKRFYDAPTQVYFVDEEGVWHGGIAYRDEIICGCCGGVYEIAEVIEFAPEYVQLPIHEYEFWNSISEEIKGGECPNSFIIESAAPVQPDLSEEVITSEC